MRLALLGWIAVCGLAQQPVPAAPESHHHAVYEDARVRILDVQIEPRESIPTHRHDSDYVWVADSTMHFSRGGVAHVERNREIIVELVQRQINPHNVCGEILPGEYLHCHEPGSEWLGANLEIQFETDQTRFGILQIAPNSALTVPPTDVPSLLIALEGAEAEAVTRANGDPGGGRRRSVTTANVLRSPADQVTEIRNTGKAPARFLVVEFGGPGE